MTVKARQFAPATERNRQAILSVLKRFLPEAGTILEIGSGTGQHAVFFAPHLKPLIWQPSDPNPLALDSIAAWCEHSPSENLRPPLDLDACAPVWPVEAPGRKSRQTADGNCALDVVAIASINVIHISPWATCLGLMAGARRILPPNGLLYLYGPFKQNGQHTAPSNQTFDRMLQRQNPAWGVRDLNAVTAAANAQQLTLLQTIPMPANNLSVLFQRQ